MAGRRDPFMDNPKDNPSTDAGDAKASSLGDKTLGNLGLSLSDREKKNLLTFLSIGIILVEFAVTIAAVCYGIINSHKLPDGTTEFRFPWIPYSVALILAPAAIMTRGAARPSGWPARVTITGGGASGTGSGMTRTLPTGRFFGSRPGLARSRSARPMP